MSDRRPEDLWVWSDIDKGANADIRPATSADLLAVVRRAVESGTIKGEVVWLGTVDSGPSIHKAVFWDEESAKWNEPEGPYLLIGPVSDGGSET